MIDSIHRALTACRALQLSTRVISFNAKEYQHTSHSFSPEHITEVGRGGGWRQKTLP